jgi:hypothetical protein
MRLAGALLAVLALTPALQAWPPIGGRGFASLDAVPAFAVCTVEEVVKLDQVAAAQRRFPWPERRFKARVLVHRAFFKPGVRRFEPGARMFIHYSNPESLGGGGGNFPPPTILDLKKGRTVLFPLAPKGGLWTLQWNESWNPVVEALAGKPAFADSPRTGRAFVFRELAQVLARGVARQKYRAAEYLTGFSGEVPREFPRFLTDALGSQDDVWLEAGCAFLEVPDGPPGNSAELVHGQASPPFRNIRQLVTWILRKGDRRDYPNRLIRCVLRNAGENPWGAALTLVDFRDSKTLIDQLNAAMRRNRRGTMTIARQVVNAGQFAVLPEGLELAQRLVGRRDTPSTDLWGAAELLMHYGDDRQFETIGGALARFKQEDENQYRELWHAAAEGGNRPDRRVLRLAAILIDDRRPGFGTIRYCDVAAGVIRRISSPTAGFTRGMSLQERDRAVRLAAEWLKAHPDTP